MSFLISPTMRRSTIARPHQGLAWVVGLWLALCLAAPTVPAQASWLDDLKSHLGNAASASRHADPLATAQAHIQNLTVKSPALMLAANVSDGGHWTFVNQGGQRFTVADAEEMGRVYQALAPDVVGRPAPVVIYVAAESVFKRPEHLKLLPKDARVRIATGEASYPLIAFGREAGQEWFAKVANNVFVRTSDAALFGETAWQLGRPLRKHTMRIVGLDPAAPDTFRPVPPRRDGRDGTPGIDTINPDKFVSAMTTLRRQSVVMTGRLEAADALVFRTPSGREQTIALDPLHRAAAAVDANLIIFNAPAPRQPGARNWLWQRVEVDGLVEALRRSTLGDFLNAMAGTSSQLFVEARSRAEGRAALRVIPMRAGQLEREPGSFSSVMAELVSEVVGNVVPHTVELDLVSKARQMELDRRLVPGLPAWLQYGFGAAVVFGLLGFPVALRWWRRIWPPEEPGDYAGRGGLLAARGVRWVTFAVLFLPFAGIPAIVRALLGLFGIWGRRPVSKPRSS